MSAIIKCSFCLEDKEACLIQHGNNENPIVYTNIDVQSHPVCYLCCLAYEATSTDTRCPLPFCRHPSWRIDPAYTANSEGFTPAQYAARNVAEQRRLAYDDQIIAAQRATEEPAEAPSDPMDTENAYEGVGRLFQSPLPSPARTPSQASLYPPLDFVFGQRAEQPSPSPAPSRRRRRSPSPESHTSSEEEPRRRTRARRGSGCQYEFFPARVHGCDLSGLLARGTNGKLYCPTHLLAGPTAEKENQDLQQAIDEERQAKEQERMKIQSERRRQKLETARKRARRAQHNALYDDQTR